MLLSELIELCENIKVELGGADIDPEVRLAIQPHWPFEHRIASVGGVKMNEVGEVYDPQEHYDDCPEDCEQGWDGRDDPDHKRKWEERNDVLKPVLYIGEGGQIGYLSEAGAQAAWNR